MITIIGQPLPAPVYNSEKSKWEVPVESTSLTTYTFQLKAENEFSSTLTTEILTIDVIFDCNDDVITLKPKNEIDFSIIQSVAQVSKIIDGKIVSIIG